MRTCCLPRRQLSVDVMKGSVVGEAALHPLAGPSAIPKGLASETGREAQVREARRLRSAGFTAGEGANC